MNKRRRQGFLNISPIIVLYIGAQMFGSTGLGLLGLAGIVWLKSPEESRRLLDFVKSLVIAGVVMTLIPYLTFITGLASYLATEHLLLGFLFASISFLHREVPAREPRGNWYHLRLSEPGWISRAVALAFLILGCTRLIHSLVPFFLYSGCLMVRILIWLCTATVQAPPKDVKPAALPALSGLRVEAAGVCPVCRDQAAPGWITCTRCETAHHSSCVTFNRRCGRYGCGSQDFRAERLPEKRERLPGAS